MINFSFGPNIFLGIIVSFGVLILYFLRNIKPEVARDEDIFFATIGLLYSCILMVHGWRLDPILLFSQVLIIVTVLVAGWENIRLRGLIANMAKLKKKKKDNFFFLEFFYLGFKFVNHSLKLCLKSIHNFFLYYS
jgi:hypothetical protein